MILQKSRELAVYTLKACRNEKIFPKSYRWLLAQPIVNEVIEAMNCIKRANAVRLPDAKTPKDVSSDNVRYRLSQQAKAYSHLEALLGMMDLAYEILPISGEKMDYWVSLVVITEEKLKAWMNSDQKEHLQCKE